MQKGLLQIEDLQVNTRGPEASCTLCQIIPAGGVRGVRGYDAQQSSGYIHFQGELKASSVSLCWRLNFADDASLAAELEIT